MKTLITAFCLVLAALANPAHAAWPDKPVTLLVASPGPLWLQTGTSGSHVPHKGGAPAIQDLLGGQVDASFQNVHAVIQHIASGKLRAIGVTGDRRSAVLPQVPTLFESGVKCVDAYSWQGTAAPRGLPAEVKARLHAALVASLVASLNDPQVKAEFARIGIGVVANTPEQFATFQQAEFVRWKHAIETRKITAD